MAALSSAAASHSRLRSTGAGRDILPAPVSLMAVPTGHFIDIILGAGDAGSSQADRTQCYHMVTPDCTRHPSHPRRHHSSYEWSALAVFAGSAAARDDRHVQAPGYAGHRTPGGRRDRGRPGRGHRYRNRASLRDHHGPDGARCTHRIGRGGPHSHTSGHRLDADTACEAHGQAHAAPRRAGTPSIGRPSTTCHAQTTSRYSPSVAPRDAFTARPGATTSARSQGGAGACR